jgi:chromosome segregation ATPase
MVTPVEKVTTLLEDLKAEVESDGQAEALAYEEYACFCKDTTTTKSDSIGKGQDTIDLLSATIAEDTATQAAKTTELQERKVKQGELAAELKATEERCAKEKADYEAKSADLMKAISSLESASKRMEGSKGSAFLELQKPTSFSQDFRHTLAFAEALGLVKKERQKAFSVLQSFSKQSVDPVDPEYKFHSQGIIDTVNQLLEEFKEEKQTADEEWAKTKKSCEDTIKSLNDEMTTNAAAIKTLVEEILVLKSKIAEDRSSLISTENLLKDDQLYLKDLTSQCEKRAKDWDQRSQLRADEITALTKALEILGSGVAGADAAVNQRALFLEEGSKGFADGKKPWNKWHALHEPMAQRGTAVSFLQRGIAAAALEKGSRQQSALGLLQREGLRLHSEALRSLVVRSSADPFAKVKELIQRLVERLIAESTAEATKKGMCDTEMGKATQDRDNRYAEALKLNVEIAGLEAKKDQLEADIDSLNSSAVNLRMQLGQATEIRGEEKVANLKTLKEAKEGLEAITGAIAVLKSFYSQAAKAEEYHTGKLDKVGAAALVQKGKASPVDEDTSGPGFDSAYKGKQEASTNIIGMLEVIKADFERTIRTTEQSEKQAAAEHVEFDRTSQTDISGKETKKAAK